jgi:arsenite-transporting ATPase
VLEAANLQADLQRAGIEPWAWVINNSVAATTTTSSLLHQRALNELVEINSVATKYSKRYAVVPMMKNEPIGVQRLQDLAAG